jgi:hypothetical protein
MCNNLQEQRALLLLREASAIEISPIFLVL